jgi:hypothetical protein
MKFEPEAERKEHQETAAKEAETVNLIKGAPARQIMPGSQDAEHLVKRARPGTGERLEKLNMVDAAGGVSAPSAQVQIDQLQNELDALEATQRGGWGDTEARGKRIEELRLKIATLKAQGNPQPLPYLSGGARP